VEDIPSDDLAPQHKLVADLRLSQQKPQIKKSGPEKLKWWKLTLHEQDFLNQFEFPALDDPSADLTWFCGGFSYAPSQKVTAKSEP